MNSVCKSTNWPQGFVPLRPAVVTVVLFLTILPPLRGQQQDRPPGASAAQTSGTQKPIQDNSFLLEEAYNQEFGIVHHINAFIRNFSSRSWAYAFTQEWPVPGVKHQLSYTLSALCDGAQPLDAGLGDIAVNYRYQLLGNGDARVAFTPRASLLVPTGSIRSRRGYGGYGVQFNLPLSIVVNKHLVTHWNAGTTYVPHARNEVGERAAIHGYNLGQSFVWLAHPRFNVLLETFWAGGETVVGRDRTQRFHDLLVSPGIRWAYNFKNGLQIVPGIGVPMGVGPSGGEKGIILYLSFEHPFGKLPKD